MVDLQEVVIALCQIHPLGQLLGRILTEYYYLIAHGHIA
jgi:hypothetical protein